MLNDSVKVGSNCCCKLYIVFISEHSFQLMSASNWLHFQEHIILAVLMYRALHGNAQPYLSLPVSLMSQSYLCLLTTHHAVILFVCSLGNRLSDCRRCIWNGLPSAPSLTTSEHSTVSIKTFTSFEPHYADSGPRLWLKKTCHYTFVCNFAKCWPYCKFTTESVIERILKIGQHLAKW